MTAVRCCARSTLLKCTLSASIGYTCCWVLAIRDPLEPLLQDYEDSVVSVSHHPCTTLLRCLLLP